MSLRIRRI